jgi:hypothetical protein
MLGYGMLSRLENGPLLSLVGDAHNLALLTRLLKESWGSPLASSRGRTSTGA